MEVAGGRIVAVRALPDSPSLTGTLVPGFVDLQVNGIDGDDVADTDDQGWARLDRALAAQGVTAWCPTLVSAPLDRYEEALGRIRRAASRDGVRPDIVGAHLEGPFLGVRHGAHPGSAVAPPSLEWVAGLEGLAVMTIGPEAEGAEALVRALVARGVVVGLGHTAAPPPVVQAAVDAGATLFTHLLNASGAVSARDPGPVGGALVDDRLAVSLIADLVHLDPVTLGVAVRAAGVDRCVLVTDAVAWRSSWAAALGVDLVDGAPRLPDGTLAGSALTMDQAVRNVVDAVGVPLADAVRMASTNPARVLGLDERGVLEPGRRADLVLLDDHLRVQQTWVRGEPLL